MDGRAAGDFDEISHAGQKVFHFDQVLVLRTRDKTTTGGACTRVLQIMLNFPAVP